MGRRWNFAIISHLEAGKTTLTEKLLLYGGAIQQAGADIDLELVHAGEISPMFFGSALTNIGVWPLLDEM